jgi:hypothetical protein
MLNVSEIIHNIPVYQNTDVPIAVYQNKDNVINIDTWGNTTKTLLKIKVTPRQPLEIYKTLKYALTVLPGNTLPIDISNFKENGLLAPLDIFNSAKELEFYLYQHTGSICIELELMDLKTISSISHLLSLPYVEHIYIKEGSTKTMVDTAYLNSLSDINNISIVLSFNILITDAIYQVLGNFLISSKVIQVREFTKPIPGSYVSGFVSYAGKYFSKVVNLNFKNIYSQTNDSIYVIGDSDEY